MFRIILHINIAFLTLNIELMIYTIFINIIDNSNNFITQLFRMTLFIYTLLILNQVLINVVKKNILAMEIKHFFFCRFLDIEYIFLCRQRANSMENKNWHLEKSFIPRQLCHNKFRLITKYQLPKLS